jgi:hypothetical protein
MPGVDTPLLVNERKFTTAVQPSAFLNLTDLPAGFIGVPGALKSFFTQGANNIVKSHFGAGVGSVQNFTAFFNPQTATIVLGFTINLPNQTSVNKFDASLRQPAALQEFSEAVSQSATFLGKVTIKDKKVLSDLPSEVGDVATGMTIAAEAGGLPLLVDTISFRRGKIAALSLVGSLNARNKAIRIAEVALKMDQYLRSNSSR